MRFLVTNDDGIDADGINVLAKVARSLGDTVVLAPMEGSSGCGHQVTTHKPLRTHTKSDGSIGVDGWPVDCVRLGLKGFQLDVDWVLSGINAGGNLGADVYISGTVAAVREAVLLGNRGIAFSHYKKRELDFDWLWAEHHTLKLLQLLVKRPCPAGTFWNVNFPHLETGLPDPEIVFCSLDPHALPVSYRRDGNVFVYQGNYHNRMREDGTDVEVCMSGRISVCQIRVF